MKPFTDPVWRDAVRGLERGDFSRLEPLFDNHPLLGGDKCRIVDWYEKGYFAGEPKALAEAFSCACFLGRTSVADFSFARRPFGFRRHAQTGLSILSMDGQSSR